jgi:hypothetical protein
VHESHHVAFLAAVELPAEIGDLAGRHVEPRLRLGQRLAELFAIGLRVGSETGRARDSCNRNPGNDHRASRKPYHRQDLQFSREGRRGVRSTGAQSATRCDST